MHRRFQNEEVGLRNGQEKLDANTSEFSEGEDELENIPGNSNKISMANGTNNLVLKSTGFCTFCGQVSTVKCDRCGDFYCSPDCQRKDWPSHRYICFPMPRLVRAMETENNDYSSNQMMGFEVPPLLKAELKSIEMEKEERRLSYKSRQLSYIPSPTPLPKDGSCVVLTGFKSGNRCYVRSTDPSIADEYNKILKKIDNYGRRSVDVNSVPKTNSFAIAQMNEKWCRVQILSAKSDNRIRVHFVDYGLISVRFLRELRKISTSMSSLPCYVNMVQLNGVTKYSMETSFLKKLNETFTGKEFRMQTAEPDELDGRVQLFHWDTNTSLSEEVLEICSNMKKNGADITPNKDEEISSKSSSISNDVDDKPSTTDCINTSSNNAMLKQDPQQTPNKLDNGSSNDGNHSNSIASPPSAAKKNLPPAPKQIPKPCLIPPFETIPFDLKAKNFSVIVVDNSYVGRGYIGCLLEKDCENLKEVQKFLQNYSNNGQSYKPKLDEYCIAEYDNEWYRAKCVDVVEADLFEIAYIDFTNELKLNSKSIRRYPASLTLPCCTNLCAINGLPENLSPTLIDVLENTLCTFKKLTVDCITFAEDNVMFIDCQDLVKKLKSANLI